MRESPANTRNRSARGLVAAGLVAAGLVAACSDYSLDQGDKGAGLDGPDIVVDPSVLSYGATPLDCPLLETVTVSNVGTAALEVTRAWAAGDTSFRSDDLVITLEPDESTPLEVEFRPIAAGTRLGQLVIASNDPDEPESGVVLEGLGIETGTTDRYVQVIRGVDVLWVIDNSGSMGEEQARVISEIEAFFVTFRELGLDYHMGVVTTDIITPTMIGRLQGVPAYITADTPNPDVELSEALAVGTEDQGDECGLAGMRYALSEPVISAENLGFLRPDAELVIVFLTDEPEQSGIDASQYISFLMDLKTDPAMISVSAIVGDRDAGCATECDGAPSTAQPGNAYIDTAEAFGGVVASICTCSLQPALTEIGIESTVYARSFELSQVPSDPTSVAVDLDGAPQATGWLYDSAHNRVEFDTAPIAGAVVDIRYDATAICGP